MAEKNISEYIYEIKYMQVYTRYSYHSMRFMPSNNKRIVFSDRLLDHKKHKKKINKYCNYSDSQVAIHYAGYSNIAESSL